MRWSLSQKAKLVSSASCAGDQVGAVFGACAVLFKDAEAYGVYVGNPAQLVRYRSHPIEITTTTE
jgi:hypothetical protein